MVRRRMAVTGLVVLGAVVGLLGWWLRRRILPARPPDAALPRPRRIPDPDARPSPDGAGVRIAVNPSSGPAWSPSPTCGSGRSCPGRRSSSSKRATTSPRCSTSDGVVAIGAAGGDGTLSAAAAIAEARGMPLIAVPAGTLNHLARDLGLDSVDDAIAAVRAGTVAHMDVGTVGDRVFVNTLSFGGYSAVVDTRERLERRLGKWPALLVALAIELPRMAPLDLEIDGEPGGCGSAGSATASTRRPGSGRRGATGSTTASSTCACCAAATATPALASRSTCSPAGSSAARTTTSGPSPRCGCAPSTGRCAWPPTARRSTPTPRSSSASGPARSPSPCRPADDSQCPLDRTQLGSTSRSMPWSAAALSTTAGSTAPSAASAARTATTTWPASVSKNRRSASRVSERPNPSVPRLVYGRGTQRLTWSGTERR